jgi:hypothetical protein
VIYIRPLDVIVVQAHSHKDWQKRTSRVLQYPVAGFAAGSTVSAVSIELDGELWEPVPGATVTSEEFAAARSLIQEIHRSLWWNPWWMTERRRI